MALVAVVGRPNVGKSTLINRILRKRETIVEETPGVTRDRKYLAADWRGRRFTLVDMGGMDFKGTGDLEAQVRDQALFALREADGIVFVVDGKTGPIGADEDIAEVLRKSTKPVVLAVNKWDDPARPAGQADFYKLGLGEPVPVSGMHGIGVGELLDSLIGVLPEEPPTDVEAVVTVAIVGRPNVGKSSLFNKFLGESRVIVHELPGTTRDTIDSLVSREDKRYLFIDTAGLRRKAKQESAIEYYSSVRVLSAIDRAELVILVVDAAVGVTDQDQKIAHLVNQKGKALVVLLNKWDLTPGDEADSSLVKARLELQFISYAPLLAVSALTGRGLDKVFPTIDFVLTRYHTRIPTPQLNQFVDRYRSEIEGAMGGRSFKVLYATQAATAPPTFLFFTTLRGAKRPGANYLRFLEREVREHFDFDGAPLRIRVRGKKKK